MRRAHSALPGLPSQVCVQFFQRISGAGDWVYDGAILGILLARGPWLNPSFALTARGRQWGDGIVNAYGVWDVSPLPSSASPRMHVK